MIREVEFKSHEDPALFFFFLFHAFLIHREGSKKHCSLDLTILQYVLRTWNPADMPQIFEPTGVCLKSVGTPAWWPAALLTGRLHAFQWQDRRRTFFCHILKNLYVHSVCVVTLNRSSPLLSDILTELSHVFRT